MNSVKLTGKTVIVTGANTGIGIETARELARRGARVILACRNQERGDQAKREIIESTKNENVVVQILDLSSLESIKKFATEFNANESRLDLLVNNAGVYTAERRETAEGFEMMFGTNHLGHFYLTYLLLDKLKESAPSRVVIVSSSGHESEKLNFDDLQLTRKFVPFEGYCKSKTANVLFGVHLAKVLEGTGVTVYSLHPGIIKTEIIRDYDDKCDCLICLFKCLFICCPCMTVTPEGGAQTTLYCCLEQSIAQHSGLYYQNSCQSKAKSHATDPVLAERLWKISAELCRIELTLQLEIC